MGAFAYTALDSAGRQHKGVLEGDTARQVRTLLREKSLLPVTVDEVAARNRAASAAPARSRSCGAWPPPTCRC